MVLGIDCRNNPSAAGAGESGREKYLIHAVPRHQPAARRILNQGDNP